MTRRRIGTAVAVLLSVIGAVIVITFVQSAEERALAGQQVVDVLVISGTESVPAGTSVLDLPVERSSIPLSAVLPDAVADLSEAEALVTLAELLPGDQLRWARLGPPEVRAEREAGDAVNAATTLLPDGYLEVTIPISGVRALGGRITPGETIALVASFSGASDPIPPDDLDLPPGAIPAAPSTNPNEVLAFLDPTLDPTAEDYLALGQRPPNSTHIMLHHVLITAVQSGAVGPDIQLTSVLTVDETDEESDEEAVQASVDPYAHQPAPSGDYIVSLALSATDVERVVFAAEYGSLWFARESSDLEATATIPQRSDIIYQQGPNVEIPSPAAGVDTLPAATSTDDAANDDVETGE